MRAVIQRVTSASVSFDGQPQGGIDHGLVILLGIESMDTGEDLEWLAGKIVNLRLFTDETGAMARSVLENEGGLLLISQFTIFASTRKGTKPSWHRAAKPDAADGGIAPTSFVEVKHKLDGLGVKRRLHTSIPHALEIGSGGGEAGTLSPVEARLVREVHRMVHQEGFRPSCIIRYRRHAFALRLAGMVEPLRVTFDDELGARFHDLTPEPDDRRCDLPLLPTGQMVMELKGFGAVPASVARCLAASQLAPRSFSKYGAAIRLSGTSHP